MKDSILHLHALCEDWKKELKYFRHEITVLRRRLSDIVVRELDTDIMARVDHFENKFNILESHVHQLMHDVKLRDRSLAEQVTAQGKSATAGSTETDQSIEELMALTSKDFYDTKSDYQKFLSQVF